MPITENVQGINSLVWMSAERNFDFFFSRQGKMESGELVRVQIVSVECVVEGHGGPVEARHELTRKLVPIGSQHWEKAVVSSLEGRVALDVSPLFFNLRDQLCVGGIEGMDSGAGAIDGFAQLLPLQILRLDLELEFTKAPALGEVRLSVLLCGSGSGVLRCHPFGNGLQLVERGDVRLACILGWIDVGPPRASGFLG